MTKKCFRPRCVCRKRRTAKMLLTRVFGIFVFLQLVLMTDSFDPSCNVPLGMENGKIKDEDIRASSSSSSQFGPENARVRKDQNGGAWCPSGKIAPDDNEWLEIDLKEMHEIVATGVEGRLSVGRTAEYTEAYVLEYWRPNMLGWNRYTNMAGQEELEGNVKVYHEVKTNLNPTFVASKIRFIPITTRERYLCMRVELYGCPWSKGIVGYSIPQGDSSGIYNFKDTMFDGRWIDNTLFNGLGVLTDGRYGSPNIKSFDRSWVGWKNVSRTNPIELIFEFDKVREFGGIEFHCYNGLRKIIQVFTKAKFFFSNGGEIYDEEPIIYYTDEKLSNRNPINVFVELEKRVGRFVKIQLYFDSQWILISEITFNSNIFNGTYTIERFNDTKTIDTTAIKASEAPTVANPTIAMTTKKIETSKQPFVEITTIKTITETEISKQPFVEFTTIKTTKQPTESPKIVKTTKTTKHGNENETDNVSHDYVEVTLIITILFIMTVCTIGLSAHVLYNNYQRNRALARRESNNSLDFQGNPLPRPQPELEDGPSKNERTSTDLDNHELEELERRSSFRCSYPLPRLVPPDYYKYDSKEPFDPLKNATSRGFNSMTTHFSVENEKENKNDSREQDFGEKEGKHQFSIENLKGAKQTHSHSKIDELYENTKEFDENCVPKSFDKTQSTDSAVVKIKKQKEENRKKIYMSENQINDGHHNNVDVLDYPVYTDMGHIKKEIKNFEEKAKTDHKTVTCEVEVHANVVKGRKPETMSLQKYFEMFRKGMGPNDIGASCSKCIDAPVQVPKTKDFVSTSILRKDYEPSKRDYRAACLKYTNFALPNGTLKESTSNLPKFSEITRKMDPNYCDMSGTKKKREIRVKFNDKPLNVVLENPVIDPEVDPITGYVRHNPKKENPTPSTSAPLSISATTSTSKHDNVADQPKKENNDVSTTKSTRGTLKENKDDANVGFKNYVALKKRLTDIGIPEVDRNYIKLGDCLTKYKYLASEICLAEAHNIPDYRSSVPNEKLRRVAVKYLTQQSTDEDREIFLKDMEILHGIAHPNICRLLAMSTTEEPYLFVMEHMSLGDLYSFLNTYRETYCEEMDYHRLLNIAVQAAAGLRYLENYGCIHRDVAARNCLIGVNDHIKLCDYSCCCDTYVLDYYYVNDTTRIPIRWMSYECFFEQRYTIKSDVWSFGVLLWEIFSYCEKRPYYLLTNEEVIDNMLRMARKDRLYVNLSQPILASSDVFKIMKRCWNLRPNLRPSFRDLHESLERKCVNTDF